MLPPPCDAFSEIDTSGSMILPYQGTKVLPYFRTYSSSTKIQHVNCNLRQREMKELILFVSVVLYRLYSSQERERRFLWANNLKMNRPHDVLERRKLKKEKIVDSWVAFKLSKELTLARACAPLFAQFAGRGSRAKSRSHPTPRELSIDVLFVSVTPANMVNDHGSEMSFRFWRTLYSF